MWLARRESGTLGAVSSPRGAQLIYSQSVLLLPSRAAFTNSDRMTRASDRAALTGNIVSYSAECLSVRNRSRLRAVSYGRVRVYLRSAGRGNIGARPQVTRLVASVEAPRLGAPSRRVTRVPQPAPVPAPALDTSLITLSRSTVAAPTILPTCSGILWKKRKRRIRSSS